MYSGCLCEIVDTFVYCKTQQQHDQGVQSSYEYLPGSRRPSVKQLLINGFRKYIVEFLGTALFVYIG